MAKPKVFSVFFSGTGFHATSNFITGALAEKTQLADGDDFQTMKFNGCGVEYGMMGTLFATGLDKQCHQVIQQVLKELKAGRKVILNAYGHSRGGVAAYMLVKQLSNIDPRFLEINLGILDAVPGNFLTTAMVDPFQISLANKILDLSKCKPLRRVLSLFLSQPLPDIICHAPVFPKYPDTTLVDEDVIEGCHAAAEKLLTDESNVPFVRFQQFFKTCGSPIGKIVDNNNKELDETNIDKWLVAQYSKQQHGIRKTTRAAHSYEGKGIESSERGNYLNRDHARLQGQKPSNANMNLRINQAQNLYGLINKFISEYPVSYQLSKLLLLSSATTAGLFFSGGLASIPLFITLCSEIGMLASLSLAAASIATSLVAVVNPVAKYIASSFFYPSYNMRHVEPNKPEVEEPVATAAAACGT